MMRAREWTAFEAVALQEAMRKSIRDYATVLGVEVTTVTAWRSRLGASKPRPSTQAILDTTFEKRATDLERARFAEIIAEGEPAWIVRNRRAKDPAETLSTSRVLTVAAGNELAAFERPADIIQRMRQLHNHDVDPNILDVIDSALAAILDRYELEGPVQLAPEVQSLRREVESLLESCRQPAQLQRLYRLSCQLAGVLAYMAVNRGIFGRANIYAREALGIAEFIRDVELQAWIKGTQSFCAYYQGDYPAAVAFAHDGIDLAGNNGQSIRLYANGLARALGKLGDTAGVDRAIDAAMHAADSIETPSGLTPALSFGLYSNARLMANAATAHLSACNYAKTFEYGQLVEVQVNESDSVWSRSLVRLDVATALVQQPNRDVDTAMDLGLEALDASRDRPIRSVWQRAHDLADSAVTTTKARTVQNYIGELRDWSVQAKPTAAPEIKYGERRSRTHPNGTGDQHA